tara:strand:- start:80 stop:919 length:840 start_codon:yes stop_codon:yes gene_type:complete
MTNHPFDLKGVDTRKIGSNKGVNLSFSEYMDRFGGGDKKIPEMTNLKQIEDFYGKNELVPGLNKTVDQLKSELRPAGLPDKTKVLKDGTIVPEDAPTGISAAVGGFLDEYLFRGATDFDKRGSGFREGLGKVDLKDLSNYQLLPSQQNKLNAALRESDRFSNNPLDNIDEIGDAYLKYVQKADSISRKGRALDNAMELANIQAQIPLYEALAKRTSTFKQRQLLDAEKIKQALPNAQQARLLAADQGFATQAGAIATQQDAATRFAGLGMRPSNVSFSA